MFCWCMMCDKPIMGHRWSPNRKAYVVECHGDLTYVGGLVVRAANYNETIKVFPPPYADVLDMWRQLYPREMPRW